MSDTNAQNRGQLSHPAWRELGFVGDQAIAQMVADGGYEAIIADDAKALKWQDVLDAALQERIVRVRNWLRERGWEGETWKSLTLHVGDDVWGFDHNLRQVGYGKNVVAVEYQIWRGDERRGSPAFFRVPDSMTMSAAMLAAHIGRIAANNLRFPNRLITAEGICANALSQRIPDSDGAYGHGFRDALELVSLALTTQGVEAAVLEACVEEALDAYSNNVDVDESDGPAPTARRTEVGSTLSG